MSKRVTKRRIRLIVTVLSLLFLLGVQQGWFGAAGQQVIKSQPGMYAIDHFVDGDTIAVNMHGQIEEIRFIGVDTPETHHPDTPVQCYGAEASNFTKQTIGSQRVQLMSDPLTTDRDRYNRLLRYVMLPDGTNLNRLLIQKGYGFAYVYFPFSKSQQFQADQQEARSTRLGIWNTCSPTPNQYGGYTSNVL